MGTKNRDIAVQWIVVETVEPKCDEIVMGEVTGFFCPDLEYLYSTRELLDKGSIWATNHLTQKFPSLQRVAIATLSQETQFSGSIILVEHISSIRQNVYRVSTTLDDQDNPYELEITKLFTLPNVQEDLKSIDVLDDFAILVDVIENVYVVIRPETEGDNARYALPKTPGAVSNSLFLRTTPIVSH